MRISLQVLHEVRKLPKRILKNEAAILEAMDDILEVNDLGRKDVVFKIEDSKIIEVYEFLDTELNAKTHDPANLPSKADDYGMMQF